MTSAIDGMILERLRNDLARGLDEFFTPDEAVARHTALALIQDITTNGAIASYRSQVRNRAIDAFVSMGNVSLTDIAAIAELQKAVFAYISLEEFVQAHLGELERSLQGELVPEGEPEE